MIGKINSYSNTNLLNNYQHQLNKQPVQFINGQGNKISHQSSTTKTSIFYVNDVHGKMTNMERLYGISKQFDSMSQPGIDKLKLASGDIILGANFKSNQVANKFLNWSGITATALGNHEMDVHTENLAKLLNIADYKLLAVNASVDKGSVLENMIGKSIIEEHNGQKYGIIGIAPSDSAIRVKATSSIKEIKIDDFETTVKKVQAEADKLRAQGVNKIILLSHNGFKNDRELAKQTDGIDVILGAHTHELIEGIIEDKNLIYSKTGEPVIITEAGKDGEHAGILNLEFNSNGVITKAQNNIIKTRKFNRTLSSRTAVESILGKSEIITKVVKTLPPPEDRLIANNPHGNIIVDAMKSELGTDIALLNAGNIRGHFGLGEVDARLISDITPFEDKMLIIKLSEADIVHAIKVGAQSFHNAGHKPGILMVSGLKYTINDNGDLLSLYFVNKSGKEIPIDINNPGTEPKYTVAVDDFFAMGGDNYLTKQENSDFILKTFDFDKNKLTCDYLKKLGKPLEIDIDDRVTIITADKYA